MFMEVSLFLAVGRLEILGTSKGKAVAFQPHATANMFDPRIPGPSLRLGIIDALGVVRLQPEACFWGLSLLHRR